ncbi:MAG: hypothetical protein ACI4PV_03930 [Butyricicoccus sp.]
MKHRLKRLAGALAVCAVLVGCALLPTALAWVRDCRQRGTVFTARMEPITMGGDEQYSLVERFRLVSDETQLEHDIQSMSFSTGVNFDHTTAQQNMRTQVDALYARGLLPLDGTGFTEYYVESVDYAADAADPACSLMAWTIDAMNEEYFVQAFMDDESGLLLAVWVSDRTDRAEYWESGLELTACAKAWANYLGLTLQEGYDTLTRENVTLKKYGMNTEVIVDTGSTATVYDEESRGWRVLCATLKDGEDEIVYRLYCVNGEFGIVIE